LERRWLSYGPKSFVAFICLNPSTADEIQNDPTVQRCLSFAQRWGFGGLIMLNIFALRSTDPQGLYDHPDPVGPMNDHYIVETVRRYEVTQVIAAWGNHGDFKGRGDEVKRLVNEDGAMRLYHLGEFTKKGQPRHPLYLKGDLKPSEMNFCEN
jgi:hypothetical protein